MKVTAVAPSNVAFIKYWGRKDEELRLPENGSLSMNLSNLITTTSVEFVDKLEQDEVKINGISTLYDKIPKHLDRVRKLAGINTRARVISSNNFPASSGLSSSASGYAALSLASSIAAGLNLSEKELSILARQGSGSACRSIPDGFVEWLDANTSDQSYAVSIFPPDYFEIADVAAIVSSKKKFLPTSEGQKSARTSPLFEKRVSEIPLKIEMIKQSIKEKDFENFGRLIEEETLSFHQILKTSNPPLNYLFPETLQVMDAVREMRKAGIEGYFTINTGQNAHVICKKNDREKVSRYLRDLSFVEETIINLPSNGARIVDL